MSGEGYDLVHIFASLPRTLRGRSFSIHHDPKNSKILYCNGNSIFIRDILNPLDCDVYTQHPKDTTAAAYAPSGFYICSGDASGKIRIWDTLDKEHKLKYEYQVLGGGIRDIAWTDDSKRIAVCGDGTDLVAKAIMWDTGTKVGDLNGPGKSCNQVDIKQTRPYRLVLGSEDFCSFFFEGPPFKYKFELRDHSNFVNVARFSPDGSKFATSGADGRCFIYDGKEGTLLGELNAQSKKIHKAGVYGLAWNADGKMLMSCSADKTVKVWNLDEKYYSSNKETQEPEDAGLVCCWNMGNDTNDMQVACDWIGDTLISVSLSGHINYFSLANKEAPTKVIKGHNKAITSSCLTADRGTLFTASYDGLICFWNMTTGEADVVAGTHHTNQVTRMTAANTVIATCSMDDTVKFIDIASKAYLDDVAHMDSQPQGIASGILGLVVVVCLKEIVVLQDRKVSSKHKIDYQGACIDIHPSGVSDSVSLKIKVAVGGEDSKVHIYEVEGHHLKETGTFPTNGNVTDVKFSPDGLNIACCTGKKQVKVVRTEDLEEVANWASHAVKVNTLAWTPDSCYLASCGIDGVVYTWNCVTKEREHMLRGAHAASVDVTSVQWSNDNTLITTGRQDCSVRVWKITH